MKNKIGLLLIAAFFIVYLHAEAASAPYAPRRDNVLLETTYDKFTDTSLVMCFMHLRDYEQMGKSNNDLSKVNYKTPFFHFDLCCYHKFLGKKMDSPADEITMMFRTSSSDWQFAGHQVNLYILADGERFSSPCTLEGEVTSFFNVVAVKETIVTKMRLEQLRAITNAQKVEMKLGAFEFELNKAEIQILKNYVEAVM
ncbi:hypothetical protein [Anaeroarcus burkinensis]|uniref:hypothetical protein n=1 Tax=Anaeroarcus burkinensis TaxID=82376 RepID=UPI0004850E36|nr:hypothetical protein [Anaeroarcus burkinensis]